MEYLKHVPFLIHHAVGTETVRRLAGLHKFKLIASIETVLERKGGLAALRQNRHAGHFPVADILAVLIILPIWVSKIKTRIIVPVADLSNFVVDIR